jgi:uncharacterized repeat protein (TIGR03803 family)
MNYKKFLGAASAAQMILIAILMLAPGAWAQSKYKTLYTFKGGTDGAYPTASLVLDQAGNLYGTTSGGGTHNAGTLFTLIPNSDGSWKEKVLHRFKSGTDGANPNAGLIFDQAGNLYGTTTSGGTNNTGTVFRLTQNADGNWTERALYTFQHDKGSSPIAGLIFDLAGDLYGTTESGGTKNGGTVFKLTPNQNGRWTERVLHNFCSLTNCADGQDSAGSLIFDQTGNLYGATPYGGPLHFQGLVFELTPSTNGSWKEKVLYPFKKREGGTQPNGGLIFDQAGNLYGTSQGGWGCVFELTPNADGSWEKKVLHQFTGRKDGGNPSAGLTLDGAGNLYGTTALGGNLNYCNGWGCGTVFKLTPNTDGTWTESVLYSFKDGSDGSGPRADVIFDATGNLYGTTAGDGITTFGSVFEITP